MRRKRHTWLTLAAFLVICVAIPLGIYCYTVGASQGDTKPFFREQYKQFGYITQSNDLLSHNFILVNPTEYPLAVRLINKSCACSVVQLPEVVMPHTECPIRVDLHVENREGFFSTGCRIGVGKTETELKLDYYSIPKVQILPEKIFIPNAIHSNELISYFTIVVPKLSDPKLDYNVTEVKANDARVRLKLAERKLTKLDSSVYPREELRYEVTVKPTIDRSLTSEIIQDAITVDVVNPLSNTAGKSSTIEINYRKHRHINGPDTATLFRRKGSSSIVTLRGYESTALFVKQIEISNMQVGASLLAPTSNTNLCRIQLAYLGANLDADDRQEKIVCTVHFNSATIAPYQFEVCLFETKE